MTCDDFLAAWNARIDDPGTFPNERTESLDAHHSSCERCRRLSSSFLLLTQRIPAPSIPAGLSDRVLIAWAMNELRDRRNLALTRGAWAAGLAAAAVALAMFLPWMPGGGRDADLATKPVPTARNLSSALAQATSATLDLARETSAPAARLGQDVYIASLPKEIAWPIGIEPTADPSEMFQSVSRKVNSSVRPLSGSARRAFSFLMAPSPGAAAKGSANDNGGA